MIYLTEVLICKLAYWGNSWISDWISHYNLKKLISISVFHQQVLEGQVSPITRSHLAFTDPDSPDPELVYNITQPLLAGQGTIEHLDRQAYSPIDLFTQADLNAEKIVYRPPPIEIGSNAQQYQFYFTGW